jgi:tRNA A-37 threonylcarbamoyl transferase component Bud32
VRFVTCEEAEPLLVPFMDRELGSEERTSIEAHLATCARCAEGKTELEALAGLLRRHFAQRAESIVTANVLRALEGEVTEALLRHENSVSPERAVAATEPGRALLPPPRPAEDSKRLVGAVLGGYRIEGEIAKGGMGTVYRATQLSMQRPVALKVLTRKFAVDETFVKRFVREAKASATIEHPNVIKVFDAGEERGETFFAMELVDGDDAETLVLRNGPFEPRRAVEIALQVARALEAAHERGVVHRDVKPANVLVTRATGQVKLADLGLAKLQDTQTAGGGDLTLRRVTMGSPNYMPPEQARDARDTDQRSDVYSLGATLYHLATGERPWGGGTAVEIISRVVDAMPLPIPEKAKNGSPLDPGIRAIIARACQKDRTKRYPTAAALRLDLETYLEGRAPVARRSQRLKPTKPATGRKAGIDRRSSGEMVALAPPVPVGRRIARPAAAGLVLGVALVIFLRRGSHDSSGGIGTLPIASDTVTVLPPREDSRPVVTPVPPHVVVDGSADREAYQLLVIEVDKRNGLDRQGESVGLFEDFLREHPASSRVEQVKRELAELRDTIAKRAQVDLDKAAALSAKGDFVAAEDVLLQIDGYGDDPARSRAKTALDALRARAKVDIPPPTDPQPPPPAPPAAPPAPSPPPDPGKQDGSLLPPPKVELEKVLAGKVEKIDDKRTRLTYDWGAASQLDDWPALAREPSWLQEALETLPLSAPYPYDKTKPWTLAKGGLFGEGFERHATRAIFAAEPMRIEVQAKLLVSRNLVVTLGDPKHPYVVAVSLLPPEASVPSKAGRPKEQQDALAKLAKRWKATFAHPSIVVAREREAFDWEPTETPTAFHADSKGTHLVIETLRDADGDALVVTADAHRSRVPLGKNGLAVGPVGIETLGRAVLFESVTIEGTLDPAWIKSLAK